MGPGLSRCNARSGSASAPELAVRVSKRASISEQAGSPSHSQLIKRVQPVATPTPTRSLLSLVAYDLPWAHFRAKDNAVISSRNPFRRTAPTSGIRVGNEVTHGPVYRAPHPDTSQVWARRPTVLWKLGARLGIGYVHHVVPVNVDPARTTKLIPTFQEVAILIEPGPVVKVGNIDHQSIVFPVPSRVSHPPGYVALWVRGSIHEDMSNGMDIFEEDCGVAFTLNNLEGEGHVHDAWHAWQIALAIRIQGLAVFEVLLLLCKSPRLVRDLVALDNALSGRHVQIRMVILDVPCRSAYDLPKP